MSIHQISVLFSRFKDNALWLLNQRSSLLAPRFRSQSSTDRWQNSSSKHVAMKRTSLHSKVQLERILPSRNTPRRRGIYPGNDRNSGGPGKGDRAVCALLWRNSGNNEYPRPHQRRSEKARPKGRSHPSCVFGLSNSETRRKPGRHNVPGQRGVYVHRS